MKRILAFFLAISLAFGVLPFARAESTDAQDAQALYEAFNKKYTVSKPLAFPYGTGEGEYTNAIEFIRAEAARILSRDAQDISVSAVTTTVPGTVASGTPLEAKTMDSRGNITPVYSESATKPALSSVVFTVGEEQSPSVGTIFLAVEPLSSTAQQRVEMEARAIIWDSIRGKNTAQDYVTQSLGKLSGSTVGALSNTPAVFKNSVEIVWSLSHTDGREDALSLTATRKTTVLRPNVGEGNAHFTLTAAVTSREDAAITRNVSFDITVPQFSPITVPVRITPSDAALTVKDSYYGAEVSDDCIEASEGGALRTLTLHASATGAAQSYSYTAAREGYITEKGTFSASFDDENLHDITLAPSTEADAALIALTTTAPAPNSASVKAPMEEFYPQKSDYTLTVGALDSVKLCPTAQLANAAITVTRHSSAANAKNGKTVNTTVKSGGETVCYLNPNAPTLITVTVTAPEGSIAQVRERVYTLTVTRTDEKHGLKSLSITPTYAAGGGKNGHAQPDEAVLFPALDAGGVEEGYTYIVNSTCRSVKIKPTASDTSLVTEITVNGEAVSSGKNSVDIPLALGNNTVTVITRHADGGGDTYTLNIRRKQELFISAITIPSGGASGSGWTFSANFPHSADTVYAAFDIPDGARITVAGDPREYTLGEAVPIAVGDSAKKTLNISLSKDFEEDGTIWTDNVVYVLGLYRMAADAPTRVESYLPAPGQFVNLASYASPDKTLSVTAGGASVTLGAFGGSVVYYFEEAIENDPANPYGIDFIVYGNVFTNADGTSASGAAEPGAVAVSEDGKVWYELAGSTYWNAEACHGASVTYTNPDTTFSRAADVPWSASDGTSGAVKENSYHAQPYYPDPATYSAFNTGVSANTSYTAESVTFSGTKHTKKHSPVYGFGDSHAARSPIDNTAANPYVKNHYKDTNGDGMDLLWAVDGEGSPVTLSKVHYVKIYNPTLYDGGTTGEVSPEISGVLRAKPDAAEVGVTPELQGLSINGTALHLEKGKFTYTFDADGAQYITVTPDAPEGTNVYVNNTFAQHGCESEAILPGDKLCIIVQSGKAAPVRYIIDVKNRADHAANASLGAVTLLPGEISAVQDGNVFTASTTSAAVKIRATPLSDSAAVEIGGEAVIAEEDHTTRGTVSLRAGATTSVPIRVTSANRENTVEYALKITRPSASSGGSSSEKGITVYFTLVGDSVHDTPEKHTAFSTWIYRKACTLPEGATVKQLTDKMLIENDIPYTVTSGGAYISSIRGLAEFSNGPNSGWMYKLNGTYDGVDGYAVQTLQDGDEVVWNYTDDYTLEDGMDKFQGITGGYSDDTPSTSGDAQDAPDTPSEETAQSVYTDTVGHWAQESIHAVSRAGIMSGTADGKFTPNGAVSRAMLAVILHRMAKSPAAQGAPFADVAADSWYGEAVTWASERGIVRGMGGGIFSPNAPITREAFAVMLFRYAADIGMDVTATGTFSAFSDADAVSPWAREALEWAVGAQLIGGKGGGLLDPSCGLTRAEAAEVAARFMGL